MGLQRLWQSESRRGLHVEVRILELLSRFFSINIFNVLIIMFENDSTASAVTVRSTIRRLREQTES